MKKIVLDAGHGFNTAGKRTPDGSNGVVREWTMNNNICKFVAEILADYDVEIIRVDDTIGGTDIPLLQRTNSINKIKPNLCISIHHNATTGNWNAATGVEVFSHPNKPKRDAELAKLFVDEMAKFVGLRNRGAKQDNLHMVRETNSEIPSVLCEGGFMDGMVDYQVITTDKGQRAYAQAVANTCVSFLGLKKKGEDDMTQERFNEMMDVYLKQQSKKPEKFSDWFLKEFGNDMERVKKVTDGANPQGFGTREQNVAMILRATK